MIFPHLAAAAPKALLFVALTVCPTTQDLPQVDVVFNAAEAQYSEEYPSSHLKQIMAGNPDSTMATDTRAIVFGVTKSETTGDLQFEYKTLTDSQSGKQCLYISKATFTINYTPAIYISSDITGWDCSYQVTRAHEQQHVNIDHRAMQEYLPAIKRNMQAYLYKMGYHGFGPYPQERAETYMKQIQQQTGVATQPMVEALKRVRRQRQGSIDTPENYKREADKCPQDRQVIYQKFGTGR